MDRVNPYRTAFLASMMVFASCGAGAQTPPLRDPSAPLKPLSPLSSTDPVVHKGLFTIDVAVTDAAGKPVSDLVPRDFTLLDHGQPARIRTWQNSSAPSEPASEAPKLIFILDTVNLSAQQLTESERSVVRFLQHSSGRMENPCFLYELTRDGLLSSSGFTRDGNLLAQEAGQHKPPRTVWRFGRDDGPNLLRAWAGIPQANPLSLRALGSIAIDQREIAGRKVAIWIGPGWPLIDGDMSFDEATELSTRLREARITLDSVDAWSSPDRSFDYHQYLEAPRSEKDMRRESMALPVIATHTGGLVLESSGDLDRDIERCVDEVPSFYTLSFNPPRTNQIDDYRDLLVQVDRASLTVRAPTGYYNEPVYFDNPRPGIEKETVAQLEELVHAQTDLPRKLANLELTERLSTPRLNALLSVIHSERERQALTADADLSIALPPPSDEVVNRPPPPITEQRAILLRAIDYLQNVIPKLPDFYASRDTVRFEEPFKGDNETWKMPHKDRTLHYATGEHATVLYRNGQEVVERKKKLSKHRVAPGGRAPDLESWGTFGPILSFVLSAAATPPSTVRWKRWERGKYGDLAVFSYRASSRNLVPELTYCCLPEGNGTTLYRNKADDDGEFALDPETGAIMRIVINADLNEERDPDVPLIRSQMMVEYGPVELGGKTHICLQRSVEISRGRSERELKEWGMVFIVYSYFETMINDVTFGGYHKFGSEARILPDFEEPGEPKTQAPPH
jgi:VWFA-related protein